MGGFKVLLAEESHPSSQGEESPQGWTTFLKHVPDCSRKHPRGSCHVALVKSVVVIIWIAFGLAAMMHAPVEALGDFADGLSCMAGVAVMGHSGESATPQALHGLPACRLISRMGILPLVPIAKSGFHRSKPRLSIPVIKQKMPGDELGLLLANWQFLRRTALAPRAPSSPV